MIKFTDNAFVGGQYFTPGMIAEFDPAIEEELLELGAATNYVITVSGVVDHATTADTATTAANATNAAFATTAGTASTATNAVHATTADSSFAADTATTAGHATTAGSADSATFATSALTASSATTATTATNADSATTAGHSTTADSALNAGHATTADSATTASSASTATTAGHATTADSATTATTATTATSATTAVTATKADTSAALILNPTTNVYPSISRPPEILSSSAIAASCAYTATDEILAVFVIRAGTLSYNSILQIEPLWTFTNSANDKILKVRVGGITIYIVTRTTSASDGPLIVLANRNSLSSQIIPYDYTHFVAGTFVPPTYTIDFSVDVLVQIIGQRANSADSLTLEYYRVTHFVAD